MVELDGCRVLKKVAQGCRRDRIGQGRGQDRQAARYVKGQQVYAAQGIIMADPCRCSSPRLSPTTLPVHPTL
jgi:hypothetical protein